MISVQTEGSSELGGGEETRALCLGDVEGRGPSCGSSPLGSNVSGCQGRSLLRTEKGPHPESVEWGSFPAWGVDPQQKGRGGPRGPLKGGCVPGLGQAGGERLLPAGHPGGVGSPGTRLPVAGGHTCCSQPPDHRAGSLRGAQAPAGTPGSPSSSLAWTSPQPLGAWVFICKKQVTGVPTPAWFRGLNEATTQAGSLSWRL